MRVTWMTPWYPWAGDTISGVFHRTQAHAVAAHAIEVRVVAARPAAPLPARLASSRFSAYARLPAHSDDGPVRVDRPPYLAVPGEPGWALPDVWIARAVLGVVRHQPRPDLVHGHFIAPTGMAARRVAQRLGVPYVLTVHGYDATSWPRTHRRWLGGWVRALREASAVITVADALGDRVRALAGVETVTIPLGVDHAALRAATVPRAAARAALGLDVERPVALIVARLAAHKGVREFAAAARLLGRDVQAVAAGDGPLRDHDPGVVRYLGPLDRPGVVAAMCAADVVVLPSYQEGLPTVLVEAGSLGIPVVATAVDGTPELLGADRGVLVQPRDATALAEAIRLTLDDPTSAAARADRLRAHVETGYDVGRNASRLVDLYMAVASGTGRVAG